MLKHCEAFQGYPTCSLNSQQFIIILDDLLKNLYVYYCHSVVPQLMEPKFGSKRDKYINYTFSDVRLGKHNIAMKTYF